MHRFTCDTLLARSIMFRFLMVALFLTVASAFQAPLALKSRSAVRMNGDETRDPAPPEKQSFDNDMCAAAHEAASPSAQITAEIPGRCRTTSRTRARSHAVA